MRHAGNTDPHGGQYDLEKMWAAALAEGVGQPDGRGGKTGFAFFGGEPLLVPLKDLEQVWVWGQQLGVPMSIQTNASLITARHLDLFHRYGVSVGVSVDGPGMLNDLRKSATDEATAKTTARSQQALLDLLARKIPVSLISTLYQQNVGTDASVSQYIAWLEDLRDRGLTSVNFHLLEVDDPAMQAQVLAPARQITVLRLLRTRLTGMTLLPLASMRKLLLGEDEDHVECIWHACDPYTTTAVRGIDGQGGRGNCGRTNKDGVPYVKADVHGHERQLALYLTPQEHGGCQGCRFFFACKGECPGTGEGAEWRSRTTHCETLMALFGDLEQELIAEGKSPISSSLTRPIVEAGLLQAWQTGRTVSIASTLRAGDGRGNVPHGDAPHGDIPHGDHTDAAQPVRTHGDHGDSR